MPLPPHHHRRPEEEPLRLTIGPVWISGTALPYSEKTVLFHCPACGWTSAVRDQGGGFAPFEWWYAVEPQVLVAIDGFWRMGLTVKPSDERALETERILAEGVALRLFDGTHCPRCDAGDLLKERVGRREFAWSGDRGMLHLDRERCCWWNEKLGNHPIGAVLTLYTASF